MGDMKEKNKDIEQIIKNLEEQGILEAIGDGVSIQDTDFKVLYQNQVHKNIIGDHAGEYCYEAYAQREKTCEGCPVAMAFKDGKTHTIERSVPTEKGIIYIEVTASPMRNSSGEIIAGVEVVREVTELKQTLKEITALKEFSEKIVEKSPIGIHVIDKDFIVKTWNSYFEEYTGIKKEDIINKNLFDVIPSLVNTGWDKNYKEVIKTGEPFVNSGYRHVRSVGPRKGEILYQSSKIVPLKKGDKTVGAITILEDITEKKKMEENLRKNEEEFRLVFENAKDAIFWADAETGVIIKCNEAAENILEKKRDEIIGQHQTILHPPHRAEYYAKLFQKHISQKGVADEEAEGITKSGKIKSVHITASVTYIGEKRLIQGIFRDITERKKIEKEVKERVEELEKFYEMAIGRELRMKELKDEIKRLQIELAKCQK